MRLLPLCLIALMASPLAFGDSYDKRLTFKDTTESSLESFLKIANEETSLNFSASDFIVLEERDLASSHYQMLAQVVEGVPVKGKSIRIWKDIATGDLIQAEIALDKMSEEKSGFLAKKFAQAKFNAKALKSKILGQYAFRMAAKLVKNHPDDNTVHGFKSMDNWVNGDLVRTVTVRGRRGEHKINISLLKNVVLGHSYKEFPQADKYMDIEAQVYPIYEEAEATHTILPRIMSKLKYVKTEVASTDADPYIALRNRRYTEDLYHPVLAETAAGRAEGYWSGPMLKRTAMALASGLPKHPNTFDNGLLLDGLYTSINYHPSAKLGFPNIPFKLTPSTKFYPAWTEGADGLWEVIPQAGLLGKPAESAEELLNRVARRLPDNNPEELIKDGFDEIQVYWAVTTFMESLAQNGFTDPELSTRPFNAFLYDPDIGMKDNAYYTDDTINFTTYSPEAVNYARDNSTIWHELGHGVMDRLMGDFITLADTGGLSEGMADFCAALVVQDIMKDEVYPGSEDYRILNNTGFALTNEVHDDGESYGGTMKDILALVIKKFGPEAGLAKTTDLTMEAMRLTRNNPALTAQGWFGHMLFADERASKVRDAGDLAELVNQALASRNFSWDGTVGADLIVKNGDVVVTSNTEGSREHPIRLNLAADETATYNLKVSLKSVENYKFQYPVTVKVEFHKGALQGAVHWDGEENSPIVHVLKSEDDVVDVNLIASGKCDTINQPDGSCKDYAYIQIFNNGHESEKPSAKKRFYLKITPKE